MSSSAMAIAENALSNAAVEAKRNGVEILNRAQQQLKDAEARVLTNRADKSKFDTNVERIDDMIEELKRVRSINKDNSDDLAKSIRADLAQIDSLRKDEVDLHG